MQERAIVDKRFFVRPILPALQNQPFYVLQLDLHHVRLLKGDSSSLKEVHVPHLPRTLDDVVRVKHPQKQHREHSSGAIGRAGSHVSHGSTAIQDEKKEQIAQFCHAIERAVAPVWQLDKAPVVLTGVNSTTDIYRQISHLNILRKQIAGSVKVVSESELHAKAVKCVQSVAEAQKDQDLEAFRSRIGTGLASVDLNEIVSAALAGRVQTLFMRSDAIAWGSYMEETGTVHHSAEQGIGDDELLNLAATFVLKDGGRVYELDRSEMPEHSAIAALYRY